MKLKVVLGIIGVVIAIAGVIYLLIRDKSTEELESESGRTGEQKETETVVKYEQDSKKYSYLNATKMETAEKIYERHEEAKKVVKDSVDRIFEDSEKTVTKNEEAKKRIFDELDNI